jgi:hypothetical protein
VLRWIGASVAGFALAGAVLHFPGSFPVGSGGTAFQPQAAVVGLVMGAVSGAVAGVLLWWAIRPRASLMLIPATALGFAVSHALGDGLPATFDYLVIGLAAGVVMGIAQLRAFRGPPDSLLYITGSALGLAAGLILGLAIAQALGLMGQAWTPALGALQHVLVCTIAGGVWGWSTGRRLFRGATVTTTPM